MIFATRAGRMKNSYNTIYLAPHLDDVVLSCGGQLYEETRRGERALIVTIMAGNPPVEVSSYAQSLHERWQLAADTTSARRREDIAAGKILGASALHWQIPDCIYRFHPATGEALYLSDDDIFGPVHPAEHHLVDDLIVQLRSLPPCERIVVPLGAGHHVDHQIVKKASGRCFGDRLEFYEDFPYVQTPGSLDFLRDSDKNAWKSTVIPVSKAALNAKVEAILAYRSQLSTFFQNKADLERQVFGYAQAVGGERFWQRTP